MPAAQVNADLRARTRELQRDLYKARGQYRRFGNDLQNQFRQVGRVGAAAAAAITAAFVGAAREALRVADETAKAARNAGLAADEYQRLAYVFRISGSSSNVLTKGVQQLARNIEQARDGLATYVREFDKLGLAADDFDGLSLAESFRLVLSRLRGLDDETQRTAISMALFGRAGREMGTLLETTDSQMQALEGRIERLGGVMSGDVLRAAEEFNDNLATMAQVVRARVSTAILEALPQFENWDEVIEATGDAAGTLTQAIIDLGTWFVDNRRTVLELVKVYVTLRVVAFGVQMLTAIAGMTKAFIAMNTAMRGAATAGIALNAVPFLTATPWSLAAIGVVGFGVALFDVARRLREIREEAQEIAQTPIFQLTDEQYARTRGGQRSPGQRSPVGEAEIRAALTQLTNVARETGITDEIRAQLAALGEMARELGIVGVRTERVTTAMQDAGEELEDFAEEVRTTFQDLARPLAEEAALLATEIAGGAEAAQQYADSIEAVNLALRASAAGFGPEEVDRLIADLRMVQDLRRQVAAASEAAAQGAGEAAAEVVENVVAVIKDPTFSEEFSDNFRNLLIQTANTGFRGFGKTLVDSFRITVLTQVAQGIGDAFEEMFEQVLGQLNIREFTSNIVSGGIRGIGRLLGFQDGGTVPGPIGAPQLAVVHGGEEIIPPGEGGGRVVQVFNFEWRGQPDAQSRIALQNAVQDAADLAAYNAA